MPANTAIKVCSRASVLMGGSPIAGFDEGTAESDVVDALYEDVARAALTSMRWRFATKQQVLNRLVAKPTGRFNSAYQKPSDILMLSAVTNNDHPIEYDTYGDKIFCDAGDADELVADYIYRTNEADWPPYFTLAVEFLVASMLAISIARDASLSSIMDQQAERQMTKARRLDSQQQTTRKLNTSRFIAQRRS